MRTDNTTQADEVLSHRSLFIYLLVSESDAKNVYCFGPLAFHWGEKKVKLDIMSLIVFLLLWK